MFTPGKKGHLGDYVKETIEKNIFCIRTRNSGNRFYRIDWLTEKFWRLILWILKFFPLEKPLKLNYVGVHRHKFFSRISQRRWTKRWLTIFMSRSPHKKIFQIPSKLYWNNEVKFHSQSLKSTLHSKVKFILNWFFK